MFTTEICLDWSLLHYEDCGWYLDCAKDVCPLSEKAIHHINDTKQIDPRDTAILQAQIVQLKLREPNQKRQNIVRENLFMKIKYKVNQKFHNMMNCLFFPMIWIRIHSEAKVQNLCAMCWNFITLAPIMLFIVRQRMF